METDFSDIQEKVQGEGQNPIFMSISVLSWLLLLITGWMCFGVPKDKNPDEYIFTFWLHPVAKEKNGMTEPLYIYYILFYLIIVLTLTSLTFAFFFYLFSIFKNDVNVLGGMLGKYSKFHFIPLLCVSALFIIGESINFDKGAKGVHYFFNILFTVLGACSLIFITLQTKMESFGALIIKHGAYSFLIALLIYNFGYMVWFYRNYTKSINDNNEVDKDWFKNWCRGCKYTFSIIIGLLNMTLSFLLNEVGIAIMNILIYIGFIVNFYKTDKSNRENIFKEGDGIVDIVMLSLTSFLIVFLIITKRTGCF